MELLVKNEFIGIMIILDDEPFDDELKIQRESNSIRISNGLFRVKIEL